MVTMAHLHPIQVKRSHHDNHDRIDIRNHNLMILQVSLHFISLYVKIKHKSIF
jgi:hypothetical protein